MANPAKAYLATQIETTTQGELLLMLYEAAIKFLKRAKREIDNRDYAKKGIYISKAMAIIHELSESLNKEKGGEISANLAGIYHFCTTELVQANIKLDTEKIDNVIKIMDGIRSAYAQIIPESGAKAPEAASASSSGAGPNAAAAQGAAVAQKAATRPETPKQSAPKQAPQQPAAPEKPDEKAQAAPKPEEKKQAQQPANGYPGPRPAQPLKPVAPRPQVNAAKSRANNAYFNAGR